MNVRTITYVSALALMIALPAYAAPAYAADVPNGSPAEVSGKVSVSPKDGTVSGDVKHGLDKANNSLVETGQDIKAFFYGKDDKFEPVVIKRTLTAQGLVGQDIANPKGEKISTVKDIIIGKDGRATLVVVSDGGVLGIGDKVAAFAFDRVFTQKADGTVVMALSQDMIDHAADFSYDHKDWAKAKVIPEGSVSTNVLLDGDVVDFEGKKVATIENVYFRGSDVSQIIVGFNTTLGMGGDLAALDYDDLQMVRDGAELDFKLTPNQTAGFKNFKKSVAN